MDLEKHLPERASVTVTSAAIYTLLSGAVGLAGGAGIQHLTLPSIESRIDKLETTTYQHEWRLGTLERNVDKLTPVKRLERRRIANSK